MFRAETVKTVVLAMALAMAFGSPAMEVPKASAVLGATKGKSVGSGLVFINGSCLEPPYIVSRWGNGIRINNIPVTGQIVDWSEFLKTQTGVKMTKVETPAEESAPAAETPASPAPAESAAAKPAEKDDSESSLDDLFDDDPKPKKTAPKAAAPVAKQVAAPKPPPVRKPTVSYVMEGEFVKNPAAQALIAKVNDVRTEIDRTLRLGGFFFFGDGYSRVFGDSRMTGRLLERLPDLMKNAESAASFEASVRAAGLFFISSAICRDLYRNRFEYIKLQQRFRKWQMEQSIRY